MAVTVETRAAREAAGVSKRPVRAGLLTPGRGGDDIDNEGITPTYIHLRIITSTSLRVLTISSDCALFLLSMDTCPTRTQYQSVQNMHTV